MKQALGQAQADGTNAGEIVDDMPGLEVVIEEAIMRQKLLEIKKQTVDVLVMQAVKKLQMDAIIKKVGA